MLTPALSDDFNLFPPIINKLKRSVAGKLIGVCNRNSLQCWMSDEFICIRGRDKTQKTMNRLALFEYLSQLYYQVLSYQWITRLKRIFTHQHDRTLAGKSDFIRLEPNVKLYILVLINEDHPGKNCVRR